MASNAKEQVETILAETQRRKRIWAEMQKVAREAMEAVTAEARRRGIRGQAWVGGKYDFDHTYVSFPTRAARMEALARVPRPGTDQHSFKLYGSGTLERPDGEDAYEDYPELTDDDPQHFREAAVAELMASLNAYIARHGRRGGRRR